jgi:hypothetical protein
LFIDGSGSQWNTLVIPWIEKCIFRGVGIAEVEGETLGREKERVPDHDNDREESNVEECAERKIQRLPFGRDMYGSNK